MDIKIEEELTQYGEKTGLQKELESNEPTEPFDPKNIKISQKMISLEQIVRRIKLDTIRLAPDFQRNEVWNITKKSQLIESLMLNIPIPMFYVAADETGNWDVVDGLQRLSTIRDFVLTKTLILQNLEFWKDYDGKGFDNLSPILYNRILETQLSITIIEPGTPAEVKYNIFKRINTGGMALSSQEIRHALYQGKGTALLATLTESGPFTTATDNSINDSRMAAREIILRCLSFMIIGPESYLLFGNNAFRISKQGERRTPINKGLFDVWGTLLPNLEAPLFDKLLYSKSQFIEKYDTLKQDADFYEAVSRTAWQKSKVEYRFTKIRELIEEFTV